jgi:hypothetical protein
MDSNEKLRNRCRVKSMTVFQFQELIEVWKNASIIILDWPREWVD